MKRIALTFVATGFFAMMAPSAEASDLSVLIRGIFGNAHHAAQHHANHHRDLQHREVHRQIEHHNAHHYPMSRIQHNNLHRRQNHERLHDAIEHNSAHYNGAYWPSRGYRGGGVHFRFGH